MKQPPPRMRFAELVVGLPGCVNGVISHRSRLPPHHFKREKTYKIRPPPSAILRRHGKRADLNNVRLRPVAGRPRFGIKLTISDIAFLHYDTELKSPSLPPPILMKSKIPFLACTAALVLASSSFAAVPFYSVDGTGGTGGGTSGVTVTTTGGSTLTDIGNTSQFSFGTGVNGVAGHSIQNSATDVNGNGVLAGTLGAQSSLSAFTLTMWINMSNTALINNYRLLEISTGSPATTSSADGNKLFFGINSTNGTIQARTNNIGTNDIAAANTWNGGAIAQNTWYFVALTYDSNTSSQLLYTGGQSIATSLQYTYSTSTLNGALDLSSVTSIALLDKFAGGRNFPGAVDDVNLYSGALTSVELEAIRQAQITAIPEPSTYAIAAGGLALVGAMVVRRRRANAAKA